MKKKWAGVLIIGLSLFCLIVCARSIATEHSQGSVIQKEEADEAVLLGEYWSEGSGPAESLNEYIASVTDQSSPDYIPVEKRIAVFDLDGTLMCETYPFCFEYMLFADYALNSGSSTVTDELIIATIATWCNMRIGNPPNYDNLLAAYNSLKGQLRLSKTYTTSEVTTE